MFKIPECSFESVGFLSTQLIAASDRVYISVCIWLVLSMMANIVLGFLLLVKLDP